MRPALTAHVELPILGMTCASCAARLERRLNELPGVRASVNLATERAAVDYDSGTVTVADLAAAVEAAGYRAELLAHGDTPLRGTGAREHHHDDLSKSEAAALLRRTLVCAALSLPVLALAMAPALQFDNWQWLSLQLATPVVVWGAWPFHKATWQNATHATATMDTLISLGVIAAWLWSLYALFLGDAGMNEMRMPFELIPGRDAGADAIYLEVAAIVTTLILLGRYFEARAKRRAGAAIRALMELGAKDVSMLDDDGREQRVPIERLQSAGASSSGPAKRLPPTASLRRASPPST